MSIYYRNMFVFIFAAITMLLALGEHVALADVQDKNLWLTGVNLSGGELNPGKNKLFFEYTYPSVKELDYFAAKGLKTFRIAVLSTRLFDLNSEPCCTAKPDFSVLLSLIDHALNLDAKVIVDFHQFGGMPSGLVGRDAQATADFAKAWGAMAKRLKDKPNVIFGLMNEPNAQSASEWLAGANAAIEAIRQQGAHQLILVPGSYWDGAHSWTHSDNAAVMLGVIDSAHHFAYEVHQYLDDNNSGTKPTVVAGAGAARLVDFTNWARQHHVKGFLGEFGFAAAPDAMAEGRALVDYMSKNRDVWLGWTYWAAGPWWGDYMFTVEPDKAGDRPQLKVLELYK